MLDTHLDHSKAISSSKFPIFRIVMTGGPCAGKTTALATITDKLTTLGFKVLIVPEAATLMMKGGAMIMTHKMTRQDQVKFQIEIMKT
jgi:nucleoside-triphosphatase THEP1